MKHYYAFIVLTISAFLVADTFGYEPHWIWGSPGFQDEAQPELVLFQRTFQVLGDVKTAVLQITSDDQYVVRVNNRLVGVDNGWEEIEQYEIASILNKGANTIFVQARNLSGPAGLLGRLTVTLSNGDGLEVVTDDKWQSSVQKSGTWNPEIAKGRKWQSVAVGEKQSDALPWKGQLMLNEHIARVQAVQSRTGPFELVDGDRVLFLGNTLVEREQRYGHWEAALTSHYPHRNIIFRNLGWSGDTVFGEARARFGSQQEGFDHLEVHVHAVKPTWIFVGYGANEAFRGQAGLDEFVVGYEHLLDTIETTGARIVLLAPMEHEKLGAPLPDPVDHNRNVQLYRNAVQELADRRELDFVDPFKVKVAWGTTLTDNGMHLTEAGYWLTAEGLLKELGLGDDQRPRVTFDVREKTYDAVDCAVSDVTFEDGVVSFWLAAMAGSRPSLAASQLENGQASLSRFSQIKDLRILGLDEGTYELHVNDEQIAARSAKEWAAPNSVDVAINRSELLEAIKVKNELYFHRWRPQNETYLFLFRKHEQGNNAVEIPMFDPLVEVAETKIAKLRIPTANEFKLIRKD